MSKTLYINVDEQKRAQLSDIIDKLDRTEVMVLCAGVAFAAIRHEMTGKGAAAVHTSAGTFGLHAVEDKENQCVSVSLGLHNTNPAKEVYIEGSDTLVALSVEEKAKLAFLESGTKYVKLFVGSQEEGRRIGLWSESSARGVYQAARSCPASLMKIVADRMSVLIINCGQAGARMHRECAAEIAKFHEEAKAELL